MVRKAVSADVDGIYECIKSAWQSIEHQTQIGNQFNQQKIAEYILSADFDYYVLEVEYGIVGVIAYRKPTHLFHFFVHEAFQRRGFGRQLWNQTWPKLAHHSTAKITVNSSLNAVDVYKKLGFCVENEICESNGLKFIKMSKPLLKNNAMKIKKHP